MPVAGLYSRRQNKQETVDSLIISGSLIGISIGNHMLLSAIIGERSEPHTN